ncbi:hypothetical protein BDZ97DRAFT_1938200 [Flammula alnicola]|nr:hypothetical protein BDZ97DRAFT_1938200 [Flammula alnicola]
MQFIGTSLALAIPLLMIRRQRGSITRLSLKDSVAPSPRRGVSRSTAPLRPVSSSTSSSVAEPVISSLRSESDSAGVGEMMSALSRMNASSALMAAKAFGIATALVAAREFGQKMRYMLWKSVPSLTSRIHRPPETDEERQQVHRVAPFGEQWNWEQAEKRLMKAYEEGGFPLWAQTALREVEAEVRVERAKREREFGKE